MELPLCIMRRKCIGLVLILCLCFTACGKEFPAAEYVHSVLDVFFQGEVTGAVEVMDQTGAELKEQHKKGIESFTKNLTSGVQMSEMMFYQYEELCDKIFMAMRYDVKEEVKKTEDGYEVTVEITPVDLFLRYTKDMKEVSEELSEKLESGEYKGTDEEILAQINAEYVSYAYELLDSAYKNMQYSTPVEFTLTVSKQENGEYGISDSEITQLLEKIMRMDEIQD